MADVILSCRVVRLTQLCLAQVLMATNRIDILDPALLRPGRIDRKIEFPNPDEGSRADILRIHSRKMNLVRGIDLKKVADRMTGASGAELKARPWPMSLMQGHQTATLYLPSPGQRAALLLDTAVWRAMRHVRRGTCSAECSRMPSRELV